MFFLDEAHNLTLEAEEMVICSHLSWDLIDRTRQQSNNSNYQLRATNQESFIIDWHAYTSNQMSKQGIQTDITFIQKPQAAVSKAKAPDDNNLVMMPIPIPKSTEDEKLKLVSICNWECSVKSKKTKQGFALLVKKEVTSLAEIMRMWNHHWKSPKVLYTVSFQKDYHPWEVYYITLILSRKQVYLILHTTG